MKIKILSLAVFVLFVSGCSSETIEPFEFISSEQIAALSPGDKTCYFIAEKMNKVYTDSPTHCSSIKEGSGNFSFYLKTSTKETAEWSKWACLVAGKIMNDGAAVGMEKIYLKARPKNKNVAVIDAYVCRNLQSKAYTGEIKEFDVLKEFNRRSYLVEM